MWRLCVQANTQGMARSACTPSAAGARRRARSDVHALDHIERRRRAKILEKFARCRTPSSRYAVEAAAPRWSAWPPACAGGDRRRPPRVRRRQRHRGEGALERAHRDRAQAVALIDDFALLGQAQHAANRAVRQPPRPGSRCARRRAPACRRGREISTPRCRRRAPPPAVGSAPPAGPSAMRRFRPACWCPNSRSPPSGDCRARPRCRR